MKSKFFLVQKMKTELFKKFILMNENKQVVSALDSFQSNIIYNHNFFRQNDYICINAVRIADLFFGDGLLKYNINGTNK